MSAVSDHAGRSAETAGEGAHDRDREEAGVRWRRTERLIEKRLGGLEGLSVIEFGAGDGAVAACMAARGAGVTVLDRSSEALARSRHLFERAGIAGEFIEGNPFALPAPLRGAYDVSMSYGLADRLSGAERAQLVSAHVRVLRHGGVALVCVPNAANPPYRLRRALSRLAGRSHGPQRPFHRRELESYMGDLAVTEFGFFGDSFARSWELLSPAGALRARAGAGDPPDAARRVRPEREGRFDERWSSSLVLWAVKDTGAL